jgi:assimilatory nitrate reductase catalytic subunit
LPGYRKITNPADRQHIAALWGIAEEDLPGAGKSAYELLSSAGQEGGVRALLVMGSNVVVSTPQALVVEERLRSLDFLVVADFFLSETAQLADIVLPTTQWAEEEGTMTNIEGRVIRRRRVLTPPANVRSDSDILCQLAHYLGKGEYFAFHGPREIFNELTRASAGGLADYAGITYERIEAQQGVFWPCPSSEHPGTPRLFQDRFPTPSGRARFIAVAHKAPAEEPDHDYPLYMTTGRVLAQYQSGTQTRRIDALNAIAGFPTIELHPATARAYGIAQGDMVRATTRRGSASFKANITQSIREDTVFIPFHWSNEQSVNRLTNPALDPISRMPEFKVCSVRIERDGAVKIGE